MVSILFYDFSHNLLFCQRSRWVDGPFSGTCGPVQVHFHVLFIYNHLGLASANFVYNFPLFVLEGCAEVGPKKSFVIEFLGHLSIFLSFLDPFSFLLLLFSKGLLFFFLTFLSKIISFVGVVLGCLQIARFDGRASFLKRYEGVSDAALIRNQ